MNWFEIFMLVAICVPVAIMAWVGATCLIILMFADLKVAINQRRQNGWK